MPHSVHEMDFGGLDVIVNSIKTGATEPGQAGTSVPAAAKVVTTDTAQTISAIKTFSTMFAVPSATVAAAGSVQGDAAAVATGFTLVTAADAIKGVILPAAVAGLVCIIKNADAANAILKIYPATGDAINAIAANSALSIAAKTSVILVAYDATTWYSVPLLPS